MLTKKHTSVDKLCQVSSTLTQRIKSRQKDWNLSSSDVTARCDGNDVSRCSIASFNALSQNSISVAIHSLWPSMMMVRDLRAWLLIRLSWGRLRNYRRVWSLSLLWCLGFSIWSGILWLRSLAKSRLDWSSNSWNLSTRQNLRRPSGRTKSLR